MQSYGRCIYEYNGDGDIDDIYLDAKGRYVRIYCQQRATQYGNSIFELGVYPKGGIPEPTPAEVEILVGDINGDGKVNSTDLSMLNRHILRLVSLMEICSWLQLTLTETEM